MRTGARSEGNAWNPGWAFADALLPWRAWLGNDPRAKAQPDTTTFQWRTPMTPSPETIFVLLVTFERVPEHVS